MNKKKPNFNMQILPRLHNQEIPTGIITCLRNRGIIDDNFLYGIRTMEDLECEIMHCIEESVENRNADSLERIFHLIQIWGGNSGRHVYIHGPFDRDGVMDRYSRLVNGVLGISDLSESSQTQLLGLINNTNLHIRWLGLSFMTKHIHFWLRVNLGMNALPIYDRNMSQLVLHEAQTIAGLHRYWHRMIEMSIERNIPLAVLEREIYNGGLNVNR